MVARSDLPRFNPFRTGLVLTTFALALVLGRAHGGYLGEGLESLFGSLIGTTGTRILGAFLLVAGVLLVSGASAGAFLRRSGHAMRSAARRRPSRRETPVAPPVPEPVPVFAAVPPPVDGVQEFPDVVQPAPLLVLDPEPEREPEDPAQTSLFDVTETDAEDTVYTLPDRSVLRRSKPAAKGTAESSARVAEVLVQALRNFGVDATVVGEIAGPRVTRYELQLAPGTKVSKVAGLKDDLSYALATTEIRILAPIPGKSAVGVEVPNNSPNLVTLGRRLRRAARDLEPAGCLAWKRYFRPRDLDRPRAHATPPDRRHDRLGQVGLHQHDPHLGPAARDSGRGADDPDRPEADRARLLRVDPAPADAGRLLAEAGGRRARERRGGDGAPLRAHEPRPRTFAHRDEPRAPQAGREAAAVPARRDRRARRPDDDLAARGGGRGHPARAEVARGRHPPRARDAAPVRGRDHRDDQGERARRASPSPSPARPTRA